MKNRIDFETAHRRIWEAVPWVLNGTASEGQRQLVEGHLPGCAECRAELARQSDLQAALSHDAASATDPEPGLRRLFKRIDESADVGEVAQPRIARARRRGGVGLLVYGLTFAVIAEAVAISVLGLSVLGAGPFWRTASPPTTGYRTLSEEPAGGAVATIRIVPASDMSLGDLRELLQGLDLQVVSGPNRSGAYALGPRAPSARVSSSWIASSQTAAERAQTVDRQIGRLRLAGMRLVEPVGAPVVAPGTPP